MEKNLKTDLIDKVCKLLQQQRKTLKDDKIESLSVFRILTNKKLFPYDIDISDEEVLLINDKDVNFKKFVFNVNPFFKFDNQEKLHFYKKYFYIADCIFDDVSLLFSKRKEPKYYSLYDVTNQTDVMFENFSSSGEKGRAIFLTMEEAKKNINKYTAAYRALGLEMSVSIRKLNEMFETLEEIVFNPE
jgi:hypothetical protein